MKLLSLHDYNDHKGEMMPHQSFSKFPALALILTATCLWLLLTATAGLAQCPSAEKIAEGSKQLAPQGFEVIKIEPTPIAGICQAQVKVQGRNRLLYADGTGAYFIVGQIIEAQTGRNLTREADQALNRLTPEEMMRVDALTGFAIGKAEAAKVLYLVTDPQCPYCKKAEKVLEQMAEKGEVSVKFLLFPLDFHKGAKEQSIAVICDNKGLTGLHEGYNSENQCADGKKKVEDTVAFLSGKGISGTPTYIFADGSYHSGLMQENQLRATLGLAPVKTPEPPAAATTEAPAAPKPAQ